MGSAFLILTQMILYAKIVLPNKSNKNRDNFLAGILYLFVHIRLYEFGKNVNSMRWSQKRLYLCAISICLATIGVCVFRALASVGALFYFHNKFFTEAH